MTPYPPLKVERDMLFATKGDILKRDKDGGVSHYKDDLNCWHLGNFQVNNLIRDGHFSEVLRGAPESWPSNSMGA